MFLINENIEIHMNERPTPETDEVQVRQEGLLCGAANLNFARKLERERDEARDALELYKAANNDVRRIARERDEARDSAEKAKAYKRVLKQDNAKLRRELDDALDNTRVLLKEIFNLTQIGDPHPADLPMKALQAIAEMIDEHLKEARK